MLNWLSTKLVLTNHQGVLFIPLFDILYKAVSVKDLGSTSVETGVAISIGFVPAASVLCYTILTRRKRPVIKRPRAVFFVSLNSVIQYYYHEQNDV